MGFIVNDSIKLKGVERTGLYCTLMTRLQILGKRTITESKADAEETKSVDVECYMVRVKRCFFYSKAAREEGEANCAKADTFVLQVPVSAWSADSHGAVYAALKAYEKDLYTNTTDD